MATTRTMGTTNTVPTFSRTVDFVVAGDDFDTQRMRVDADALTAAIRGTGSDAQATYRIAGAEVFVQTKHRPLGQYGANKPSAACRLQFRREDGQLDTINTKLEFSVPNGMSGQVVNADGTDGGFQPSSELTARMAAVALAVVLQAVLGPSAASFEDSLKRGLLAGIALVGA